MPALHTSNDDQQWDRLPPHQLTQAQQQLARATTPTHLNEAAISHVLKIRAENAVGNEDLPRRPAFPSPTGGGVSAIVDNKVAPIAVVSFVPNISEDK